MTEDANGHRGDAAPHFGSLDDYRGADVPGDDLDHGFEPEAAPQDDLDARRAKGWTTRTIVVAALTLALLNAHSLQSWATTLAPEWGGETIRTLANAWYDRTADAGLDRPRAAIHDAYEAKKGLGWGDLGNPADSGALVGNHPSSRP